MIPRGAKASELIRQLKTLKSQYGDLEVYSGASGDGPEGIEKIFLKEDQDGHRWFVATDGL